MTTNPFQTYAVTPDTPSPNGFVVTPSDSTPFPTMVRRLFVGGNGNITLITAAGTTLTFSNVQVGAMIDTREKQAGRLLDHLPISALHGFVTACHAAGLSAGLAGSLELPDIPRLLVLTPDLLGFRGALCGAGERMQTLDPSRVQAVRALIGQSSRYNGIDDVAIQYKMFGSATLARAGVGRTAR